MLMQHTFGQAVLRISVLAAKQREFSVTDLYGLLQVFESLGKRLQYLFAALGMYTTSHMHPSCFEIMNLVCVKRINGAYQSNQTMP